MRMTGRDAGVPLPGGQMADAVRVGDTVRRLVGRWTPEAHRLLRHLEAVGFAGVPRVQGIDAEGREVLTFLEGEAGFFDAGRTVPPDLWSDRVLVEAAALLRRYHDATVSLAAESGDEVVCHNDFAPYNIVFRGGLPVALIDFDEAAPGSRLWDIAYAVYSFTPLFTDEKCRRTGLADPPDRSRKIALFCDAYGPEWCAGIVDAVVERVRVVRQMVLDRAAAGDPRFARSVAAGHVRDYQADLAIIGALPRP